MAGHTSATATRQMARHKLVQLWIDEGEAHRSRHCVRHAGLPGPERHIRPAPTAAPGPRRPGTRGSLRNRCSALGPELSQLPCSRRDLRFSNSSTNPKAMLKINRMRSMAITLDVKQSDYAQLKR